MKIMIGPSIIRGAYFVINITVKSEFREIREIANCIKIVYEKTCQHYSHFYPQKRWVFMLSKSQ